MNTSSISTAALAGIDRPSLLATGYIPGVNDEEWWSLWSAEKVEDDKNRTVGLLRWFGEQEHEPWMDNHKRKLSRSRRRYVNALRRSRRKMLLH